MIDLAITGERVLVENDLKPACVLVSGGVITDVVERVPPELNCVNHNIGQHILMPGIIDSHVHINEPGRADWEGFETATQAAIAGGVTTLVDMPLNSSPVTTTVSAFNQKTSATEGKLYANCGFWGGVVPGNESHLFELAKAGVLGFKAFLTHSGIDEFPNVTGADLAKAMPIIADLGLPLLVHAELDSPLDMENKLKRSYAHYLKSRPKKWEDDAIALMIDLCRQYNCRTHIVHLSSSNSIEQIRKAKLEGLPITTETCPHYLYFNAEEILDGSTMHKCAPPIREKANNALLWNGLKDGVIDFVVTDHSPAPPQMKALDSGDFGLAWGGVSGIQFALAATWSKSIDHGWSIVDVSKRMSKHVAEFLQLKKGEIKKGYDADFIVWNENKSFVPDEQSCLFKHKISPFMGERLKGVVNTTYLKGKKVFENGEFLSSPIGEIILGK